MIFFCAKKKSLITNSNITKFGISTTFSTFETNFYYLDIYLKTLKKYWGYDSFRSKQDIIIKSIGEGKDTIGLLPTGGGKSITFQIPALTKDGVCIVVTPLVALMKDQVANLKKRGIKALAVHSGLTFPEINIAYDNCVYGNFKFLYLSPERLSTPQFLEKLPHFNVSMLVIDEAHCISQWGYDFRPSYLKISELREHLPEVPILALTATATPEIADDIQERLLFKEKNLIQKSFERKNIAYIVRQADDKQEQLIKIIKSVPGCGIVFVRNRKKTREYTQLLRDNGISAHYFHAGLANKTKDQRQKEWMEGTVQVMVCTNAFGMGIDKPDVRSVVHMDVPDSLEAYFQEAGRAGRDEKKAYAVLLWSNADKTQLKRKSTITYPDKEVIFRVYEALGNFFQLAVGFGAGMVYDFNIVKFCKTFKFNAITVINSLKILQRAGYLEFSEEIELPSRLHFTVHRDELYKYHESNSEYEEAMKVLLRSYSGTFSDYVNINEEILSRRANMSRETIYQFLSKLNHLKIAHYIPQKKTPLLNFTRDREEIKYIKLLKEVYQDRKEQYQKRIEEVIHYGETSHICRSKLLVTYFGQKQENGCGICDVCLAKKKKNLSGDKSDKIEKQILEFLMEPKTTDQILNHIKTNEDNALKIINWLADNGVIFQNDDEDWEKKAQ
ncbi:RecQ family ATP-dependent DNA helicase [bacterium]|nr:RecQ family ATP-dependent DNA helicase [bacterium]